MVRYDSRNRIRSSTYSVCFPYLILLSRVFEDKWKTEFST